MSQTPKLKYFCRMECGRDDRAGKVIGPFEDFLQLTYAELRAGPNGEETIAEYDGQKGDWYINPRFGSSDEPWSDVVIWAEVG